MEAFSRIQLLGMFLRLLEMIVELGPWASHHHLLSLCSICEVRELKKMAQEFPSNTNVLCGRVDP